MKFVLNRNKTLVSTLGHAIAFVKGVPTYVPRELWPEAQAIGATPEAELPEEVRAPSREPIDPALRREAIFAAFEQLVAAGKRETFTATGVPHAKALGMQMGFAIDNKERDALWLEYRQAALTAAEAE